MGLLDGLKKEKPAPPAEPVIQEEEVERVSVPAPGPQFTGPSREREPEPEPPAPEPEPEPAPAPREPEPPIPNETNSAPEYTQADLDALKKEVFEAGFVAGVRAAKKAAIEKIVDL